jgi:hypothetical protein
MRDSLAWAAAWFRAQASLTLREHGGAAYFLYDTEEDLFERMRIAFLRFLPGVSVRHHLFVRIQLEDRSWKRNATLWSKSRKGDVLIQEIHKREGKDPRHSSGIRYTWR